MSTVAFWRRVVNDTSGFLERVVEMLQTADFPFCVIGGVAVNAYSYPVVTEDMDIVLAVEDIPRVRALFEAHFRVREFEHSINVYDPGSNFQLQIQRDAELGKLLEHVEQREVYGLRLPIAAPEDLLKLKIAAALEPSRRGSKRNKDVSDISRLTEAFPELLPRVPTEIRERMFE